MSDDHAVLPLGARLIVRACALLVPRRARADWRLEWLAELGHEAHRLREANARHAARTLRRIAAGALRDALAMRMLPGASPAPSSGASLADAWLRELRLAARALLRAPTLAAAAVVTLALGIGANTAVFSVINGVLLRPLPFDEPERLVAPWPNHAVSNREITFIRENGRVFDDAAALSPGWLMALTGVPDPTQLNAARVSANFFDLLGVPPLIGRTFDASADLPGGENVAVLSHALWTGRFAGAGDIIGRTITLDGTPYTVIGVTRPGVELLGVRPDLFTPFPIDRDDWTWTRGAALAVARLAPDATTEQAVDELRALQSRMIELYGLESTRAVEVAGIADETLRSVRGPLLLLLGAVGMILLIACANVANLLLVRTIERRQEIAVRIALGASRAAVMRTLLAESLILATAGGCAGLLLAIGGTAALRALLPADTPRIASIGMDAQVLLAGIGASLLAGLVFGGLPALLGTRSAAASWLRRGRGVASGATRVRGALVAAEIALAVVLAAGAGLMGRTLFNLYDVDPGFDADRMLTMRMQPSNYSTPDARRAYWREVLAEVRAVPGVEAAGTVLHLPLAGRTWGESVELEHRPGLPPEGRPHTAWQAISVGYLDAAGIPVLRGRDVNESDVAGAEQVVIINEAFARAAFEDIDPLGRRIRTGTATGGDWATIIGIAGSVHHEALDAPPVAEIYVPFEQRAVGATSLVVRTSVDPRALSGELQNRIRGVDPDVPISQIMTMRELIDASLGRPRLLLALLGAFAVLGVTLGATGIAGVVAWVVRQRRREIGIRVALGASPRNVASLVAAHGIAWAALGVAIGIPISLALARVMQGLVFGVTTADPFTFAAVPIILLAVATLAGYLPARRAARVHPAEVLAE